jgi:hypothetical protein
MESALGLILPAVAWVHVFLAPYTKVEESFNLHAAHDVFFYGVSKPALRKVRMRISCLDSLEISVKICFVWKFSFKLTSILCSMITSCSLEPYPGHLLAVFFWDGQRVRLLPFSQVLVSSRAS